MNITRIAASQQGQAGITRIRDWLAAQGTANAPPLAERRAKHDGFTAAAAPVEGVDIRPTTLGGIRALAIAPPDAVGDWLFVHGGAYVLGSPESHGPLAARYARAFGAHMHAPAYRLAPEHPYPAALDDVIAAFAALPTGSAMLGTSAGGGLVLAAAIAMRDRGMAMPTRLLLIAPWIDLTLSGDSVDRNALLDPMLSRAGLAADADAYRGSLAVSDPQISPLFADLAGLPPIFVQVGEDEVLLDDSLRLERTVTAAGGRCHVEIWEGMTHSWMAFADQLPEAEQSIQAAAKFVAGRG